MMKIYMVFADNCESYEDHSWWNVRAFTSREAAQAYIETFTEEIKEALKRLHELEVKKYRDGLELTEDEMKEYERVDRLGYCYDEIINGGTFDIEEIELQE